MSTDMVLHVRPTDTPPEMTNAQPIATELALPASVQGVMADNISPRKPHACLNERGSLGGRIVPKPRIGGGAADGSIPVSMDPLYKKAIAQGVAGMAVFVPFIFLPAGTWHYWQGWLFIAVFSVSTIGFTVYLALYDRPLLERRMNAGPQHEKEWSQKIIVSLIILAFFVFLTLPPLDYRVGLSPVPAYLSFVGEMVIVLSFLFIF